MNHARGQRIRAGRGVQPDALDWTHELTERTVGSVIQKTVRRLRFVKRLDALDSVANCHEQGWLETIAGSDHFRARDLERTAGR